MRDSGPRWLGQRGRSFAGATIPAPCYVRLAVTLLGHWTLASYPKCSDTSGSFVMGIGIQEDHSLWYQQRTLKLLEKIPSIAFTSPGAPSEVTQLGVLKPLLTMSLKNSVQHP